MKLKTIIYSILAVATLTLSSCKKLTEVNPKVDESAVNTANNPNAEVNSWVYDQLKTYYLWETDMMAKAKTDNKLSTDKYFESLLVKPGEVDRFSWIQKEVAELTASLNGVNKVLGIRNTPFFADAAKTKIALAIAYSLKGSPADKAGIKRGDFITKVDGIDLTPDNYTKALTNETLKLTLGEYVGGEIKSTTKVVTVTKEEHQTDPIQHYSIIEIGNKKIGYLVYLQFLTKYDANIRNVFKEFKDKGVNELVLDFRYNGGGFISSSDIISSLIVKDLKPGSIMSRQVWNTQLTSEYKTKYGPTVFDTNWKNEPNNLGTLNRVYVLTSRATASASELVINNLKPFMDVILIGGNTYGKNVGSITLSDDKKRWNWGMQPIVLKTVNAKGDSEYGTKDGFIPNFIVSDNTIPFKNLGDPQETFLKVAIENITGKAVSISQNNARQGASRKVEILNSAYPLDNPQHEIRDMWINRLPGQN